MKNKGFTLIELIIVIAILAILCAISIPVFAKVQTTAREKADKTSASIIARAAELYYQENDMPSSIDISKLESDGYIDKVPKPQSVKDKNFVLTITDGKATVTLDDKTLYPLQS